MRRACCALLPPCPAVMFEQSRAFMSTGTKLHFNLIISLVCIRKSSNRGENTPVSLKMQSHVLSTGEVLEVLYSRGAGPFSSDSSVAGCQGCFLAVATTTTTTKLEFRKTIEYQRWFRNGLNAATGCCAFSVTTTVDRTAFLLVL